MDQEVIDAIMDNVILEPENDDVNEVFFLENEDEEDNQVHQARNDEDANHQAEQSLAESSDENIDIFDTKVFGAPVVAYGELNLNFYLKSNDVIDGKVHIEKIFGLVKKDNSVLKFRLILKGEVRNSLGPLSVIPVLKLTHEFVYLSDEPILCSIRILKKDENGIRRTTEGTMLDRFPINISLNTKIGVRYKITIKIGQYLKTQEKAKNAPSYARKFNDDSTSDFRIKCKDSIFYVHQWILADRCEYFAAILRNDCVESRRKELSIDDFEPEIVEAFLRYVYNGTLNMKFHLKTSDVTSFIVNIMEIADKYNFTELINTCDSYLGQFYACRLNVTENKKYLKSLIKFGVEQADKLRAKKLSAAIFLWKQKDQTISDSFFSSLIDQLPNFANLVAKTASRKDYRKWIEEHESWCFDTALSEDDLIESLSPAEKRKMNWNNNIAIIAGAFGEMKDATECDENI